MTPLPIDTVLPTLRAALVERDEVVLEAPPGAGKTTRVPLALLDEPWLAGQRILMLEPRRWWAAQGSGAWTGRSLAAATRLQVSEVGRLQDASLSYSSLSGWEEQGRLDRFLDLTRKVWRTRGYGDFWSHVLVAEGAVDLSAEPELALHDMAALVPIVTEAGGRFTSVQGVDGPFGGSALVSNGRLHGAALQVLDPLID